MASPQGARRQSSGAKEAAEEARAFAFLPLNRSPRKPRERGLTEIRGPYYTPLGQRQLADILDTMGAWVDSLKFAGGSFALMPKRAVRALIDQCHAHGVKVSTGGFIEHVLTRGPEAVDRYLEECADLGFDIVEVSNGFVSISDEDMVRLTRRVLDEGLVPKPEVGIQFGAGGASAPEQLEEAGARDVASVLRLAKRHLQAGAPLVMIESEGITESVRSWRVEVAARVVDELGLDKVMFEAADPAVFEWYVKTFGPDVNLFVDHAQIVQLECLRSGLWGTASTWGRVVGYRP